MRPPAKPGFAGGVEFVMISADGGSYACSTTRLDADLFAVTGALP